MDLKRYRFLGNHGNVFLVVQESISNDTVTTALQISDGMIQTIVALHTLPLKGSCLLTVCYDGGEVASHLEREHLDLLSVLTHNLQNLGLFALAAPFRYEDTCVPGTAGDGG